MPRRMLRPRGGSVKHCAAPGSRSGSTRASCAAGTCGTSKIRQQIHDCALFVPVISAHTEARTEGYFRLEWKLAVDRSYLMADDAAFLFPVVIDDTPDASARVPEKFRTIQWTRLPDGQAPAAFARRVAALLAGTARPEPARRHTAPGRARALPGAGR